MAYQIIFIHYQQINNSIEVEKVNLPSISKREFITVQKLIRSSIKMGFIDLDEIKKVINEVV